MPSMLEFYSYLFCFHGFLCGPFAFFSDYKAFIDGSNYDVGAAQVRAASGNLSPKFLLASMLISLLQANANNGSKKRQRPSPIVSGDR